MQSFAACARAIIVYMELGIPFFAGIDSLSASGKHALLGSVHVGTVPDYGKFGPLAGTQCYPLPESAQKQELQISIFMKSGIALLTA
jgi:hypothetical protein